MLLKSLGYVAVAGADLIGWEQLATGLLGMQVAEQTKTTLALRMDDRCRRLLISSDRTQAPFALGWEVANASDLDALCARLGESEVQVARESASVAALRGVTEVVSFQDPVGNRLEAFLEQKIADAPFEPARPISGFRTGPLGLGHAVLTVERIDSVMSFYQNVLGFRLSDYTLAPFKAYFFHINPRHHSLALVETGRNGLHHLMMELMSLDDVGQAYDIAQASPDRVSVTLGRHSNDLMTSFYTKTPSPFLVEYGWGGANVDMSNWAPQEYKLGPSLWGHERAWLSPEKRAQALALRLKGATLGVRAPVQVLEGNYHLMV